MAVVVARRPGTPTADVLAPVLGVPAVLRAVRAVLASGSVDRVVLLVDPEAETAARDLVVGLPVSVHTDPDDAARCAQGPGHVLLHDAARPLASPALAEAVTRAVAAGHAVAVPVLPLSDTVKHVDSSEVVTAGPDRAGLRVIQMPQAFRAGVLDADVLATILTSAEPLEQAWSAVGEPAVTVPGNPMAFAVCSPWQRRLAEVLGRDPA